MNWTTSYNIICAHLARKGLKEYSEYLKEAFLIGATGGEIFDIAITRMIELKRKGLLEDVSNNVIEIINYAKSIDHLNQDFEA